VLKHAEFAHLREVPEFPNALRPVDSELTGSSSSEEQLVTSQGLSLVREMVRQVNTLSFSDFGSYLKFCHWKCCPDF
jgi:hypothetical protein